MQFQSYINHKFQYRDFLVAAFKEDIPNKDLTTDNLDLRDHAGKARLVAKEDLILSGIELFKEAFLLQDPDAEFRFHFFDGDKVYKGQTICDVKGEFAALLKAERVALNLVGKLSGIASFTRCFVDRMSGSQTKLLDTRKILPLYRDLAKKAVRDGGGHNHRMNLSDGVLIKENHIRAAGGITKAVTKIRQKYNGYIEVETTNLDEVMEAVQNKVQRIMLDNMTNEEMAIAIKNIPADIHTEASGNMNLDRIAAVSKLGLTYVSVGAITHSAPTADISLLFHWDVDLK